MNALIRRLYGDNPLRSLDAPVKSTVMHAWHCRALGTCWGGVVTGLGGREFGQGEVILAPISEDHATWPQSKWSACSYAMS